MLDALKPVLEDPSVEKVGHDLKFDAIVLARHGIELAGIGVDTMLASYLLDSTRTGHPLEATALEHLSYKALTEEDVCGRGAKAVSLAGMPRRRRSSTTPASGPIWRCSSPIGSSPMLTTDQLDALYRDIERPLIPVLAGWNRPASGSTARRWPRSRVASSVSSRDAASRSIEIAGEAFNINSPPQLSKILFDKLQLPALKRNAKTRTASTAVEVLEELALAHELPRLILDWRALQKLKGHLHRRAAAARESARPAACTRASTRRAPPPAA